METNEVMTNEVIETAVTGAESIIDAAAEGAKDTAKVYILAACAVGAGIAIAADAAWKHAIKPGIGRLKELKKKHDEKKLESYIDVTEVKDNEKSTNDNNEEE